MTETTSPAQTWQEQLQLAALGWMHRHHAQFGCHDRLLCAAAVRHLMDSFDASQEAAENSVIRAYGEFRHQGSDCYLDISLSSGAVATIRDPSSGVIYAVPVKAIIDRLIPRPSPTGRVYLVNTTSH